MGFGVKAKTATGATGVEVDGGVTRLIHTQQITGYPTYVDLPEIAGQRTVQYAVSEEFDGFVYNVRRTGNSIYWQSTGYGSGFYDCILYVFTY